jgi:predicted RecA/RadA family phage recombinase
MPYIQRGETIDYTNPGPQPLAYNDVVNLTTRIGIAGENISVGATGSAHVVGVYELPAINNAAFAVGEQLYWDPVAGVLTNVAQNNVPAGWATEPKALADTTARVKID